MRKIDVVLLSGFLGAGKTTLLRRMLAWESDLTGTVVVVNDFGNVGIDGALNRPVTRLSRGERQRVAICRALVPQPQLLLADEPTGSLDPRTKSAVVDALLASSRARETTLIMATHDHDLLDRFDRVMEFGPLAGDPSSATVTMR